jgi:NADH dehydrogenase (ubiquinone) Fe-S protein 5
MSLGPFIRLPFTDLTGSMINHQTHDKCGSLEMKMMDCLEAYGMDRGTRKCKDLIEDFQECAGMKKQLARIYVSLINFVCAKIK